VFNKPHNYYLELLTEVGIAGFAVYILILIKMAKKLPFYLLPGLTGFVVSNIFGWPVVSTALLFWFWAGWAGAKEI
jgi:O-antigen ligase